MVLDPERQAALVALRAAALTRDHFHLEIPAANWTTFGTTGAAAADDGHVLVFPAATDQIGLGAVLAWSSKHELTTVELVFEADEHAETIGIIARQASLFSIPIHVWQMTESGQTQTLVTVTPASYRPRVEPSAEARELATVLSDAALEIAEEDGEIIGEIRGLEVARVVEPAVDEGAGTHAHIEVGIGRFDREAFALMHAGLSAPEALAQVINQVGELRQSGAEGNPLNRLARERWLRSQLLRDPSLVGATTLHAVENAEPRGGLRENAIASALGVTADGQSIFVATSTGVNLEAVVDAADTRAWYQGDADLVLVVPPSDDFPVTRRIMNLLTQPGQVVSLEGEWSGVKP